MPLVGLIETGTVERIFQSVSFAKADVLVLFACEKQFGHVVFQKGLPITACMEDLVDQDAIAALQQWTSGHYSLVKRGAVGEHLKAHVLLNGLAARPRRNLSRWLKKHKYQMSLLGYPEQALPIISFLQPDVILTSCPKLSLGLTCSEMTMQLRKENILLPLIISVDDKDAPCTENSPLCRRIKANAGDLEKILSQNWPKTRFGARQSSVEVTAKISTPTQTPTGDHPSIPNVPSEDLTAQDFLRVFTVLLCGSTLIWVVWWILQP